VTCQVFLSAKAQQDLDAFPDKIARQILANCARLAGDPIPDGKHIKKLQGFKESLYRLRAGDYRVVQTVQPALFMTVRCEIVESRRETGKRSGEGGRRT
jgi:mRNA-degrading endonuclease RelE of RelBE toxin-antitoxin system